MQMPNPSLVGLSKADIETPVLIIDLDQMQANIDQMARFLSASGVKLRPHFKTHKSPLIAQMQIEAGAIGITCAKLGEAEVLALSGINDILIANQIVQPSKIARLASLARLSRIIVAVDTCENARAFSAAAQQAGSTVGMVIEVDVGLGRCGVKSEQALLELVDCIQRLPAVRFRGLLGYEGHAVLVADRSQRTAVATEAMAALVKAAELVRSKGVEVEIVSAGGTGTFDITGAYPGITEIEAGSYLFMDAEYGKLGLPFRSALTLLATIIHISATGHAVMDAGMKCLSTDNGLPQVVCPSGVQVVELNEEHGILKYASGNGLRVGDQVELIPSHICTTVNLHDVYYGLRGNRVEAIWPVAGRGKFA